MNILLSIVKIGNETQYRYCFQHFTRKDCNFEYALEKCEDIREKFKCEEDHEAKQCKFRYKDTEKECCLKYSCFNPKESGDSGFQPVKNSNEPSIQVQNIKIIRNEDVNADIKSVEVTANPPIIDKTNPNPYELRVTDDNSIISENFVRYLSIHYMKKRLLSTFYSLKGV